MLKDTHTTRPSLGFGQLQLLSVVDCSIVYNHLLPPHFCHVTCRVSCRQSVCPCLIVTLGHVICFGLKRHCDFLPALLLFLFDT